MSTYQVLFDFEVGHNYFSNQKAASVRFEATHQTAKLIKSLGLIERRRANGIALFFDMQQLEALQLYAEDEDEPLQLVYKGYVDDPLFERYTDPSPMREGEILRFRNDKSALTDSLEIPLHNGAVATIKDFVEIDTLQAEGYLLPRDSLIKPSFLIQLDAVAKAGFRSEEGVFFGPQYRIHFAAAQSYWKYFLLGDLAKRDAYIVDLGKSTEFELAGEEVLADQEVALTYVSTEAIAMQQRSECRFQLRESGYGNGKVLIKRLPVASAKQVGRSHLNGKEVVVSEIYVNC